MRHAPSILIFVALGFSLGCSSSSKTGSSPDEPPIKQYQDKESGNWTAKADDQAFELVREDGCVIKWNVISWHARPDQISIEVRDGCRDLKRSLPAYGRLLDAVLAKVSKDKVRSFSSSSWHQVFSGQEVGAWEQELAVAAIESGLWKAFVRQRKQNKKLQPEKIFIGVFNQGRVALRLTEVFEARGLALKLKAVGKIHEKQFKDLPFAHGYAAYSSSKFMVPYGAESFTFDVKPVGAAE